VIVAATPLRVLIVEDSEADAEFMLRALRNGGIAPAYERVQTADAMKRALEGQSWDVVLSDYSLPGFDAPSALALLQAHGQDIPFIVVSGSVGEDTAVAMMKAGADDYIMKDRLQRLAPAVSRAVADAAVRCERQRLAQQLQESQRLEAVGRLAGGVAHDFNNVLTAILGSTELLLLSRPPDAPKQEELEIIRDAGLRAKELIRQLLAFSARQVLTPTVLDLNHLVKNVHKMLRRLIGEDIELVTELVPDPGAVRADAGQMEQVLVNLVVNARDAMPKGGRLTIATANVDIADPNRSDHRQVPLGHYVTLRVTDTGIGMDRETQAHAFEPFFTTKPRGQGTGLGLAPVYGIVRQSGGHITLDSAPGAGTTFQVYLPRVAEAFTPVSAPAAVAAPAAGTGTVLLAEDEHLVRLLARKTLEQAGYRVLVAAGAPEALEIAQSHDGPIDLLLTDVVMPEMSGRDLTHRLTQQRPGVRVLYMSGYSDEAVARHGVLDDGTAFIQKPFTPGELASKVRDVLQGS
jgi:two-component system, cell cycle sensor histidine kinase and response regulator CckA